MHAELLTDLAHRLAGIRDLPTRDRLHTVLSEAGWRHDGRIYVRNGLEAWIEHDEHTAGIAVVLADYGSRDDLVGADDFETADLKRYTDAETFVDAVADALALPPADPFAGDAFGGLLLDSGHRRRLRSGHWVVALAGVEADNGLPLQAEAHLTYGADLARRLTELAPPPASRTPREWPSGIPADQRWLLDTYGPVTLDGRVTLLEPAEPTPATWNRPRSLPVARRPDGTTILLIMEPEGYRPWWHLQAGDQDIDQYVNLLHYVVVLLCRNNA